MDALTPDLRRRLEKAVREARTLAEAGARQALEALAVDRARAHEAMGDAQKTLRKVLRAHGKQLGDVRSVERDTQEIRRLGREVAYEHWHRMLFARFLAENELLIEPASGLAVSLADCEEWARDRREDPWALAASFAEHMLPQIFRHDDPALQIVLPPETRQALERLIAALPKEVFTAGDALGWTYQFWQAAEKDAVNARVKSGEKITGETLPAVTQLFTEPYMVQFLLHNTLGAWHAGKALAQRPDLAISATSEQELRDAVALPGYAFEYLRFVREPKEGDPDDGPSGPWRPAAGTYAGWPRHARDLKVLDPCCGSGHFLVAALDLLARLRGAEEGLALNAAIRAVLAENLFGLELDARCTQIAAFHLALAAWKRAGRVLDLPSLHIACSGLGPNATKEEWLALAEQAAAQGGMPAKRDLFMSEDSLLSASLKNGLAALYETFTLAPELGSLIDPRARIGDMFTAGFEGIEPVLARMLNVTSRDGETHERAVTAHGMARAAQILTGTYTLVVTNVPYLGRGSQSNLLKDFAEAQHKEAKNDLATMFVSRMLQWVCDGGSIATVTPQSWLFLGSYAGFRKRLLRECSWAIVARLGNNAFRDMNWWAATTSLVVISASLPGEGHSLSGLDVSSDKDQSAKADMLAGRLFTSIVQRPQVALLRVPDARVTLERATTDEMLGDYATSFQGLATADYSRFGRKWWEVLPDAGAWALQQSTVAATMEFGGREHAVYWQEGSGELARNPAARVQGLEALGRIGVAVSQIGDLPVTRFMGELFDNNTSALVPRSPELLPAVWCFCSSPAYATLVRSIDQSLKVTNASLGKVPFDLEYWRRVAAERYPDGLPEPYSNDPTQWLFHGHPAHAEPHAVLQVAVARLLGYRWLAEVDPEMHLAMKARALVEECKSLDDLADADGVVCFPSVRGEAVAMDRLRALLARAFGGAWSAAREQDLLQAAGEGFNKGKVSPTLEDWLRERFFVEHCALFHSRPFVWHVWDGRPDGFHALVNYHRLAGKDGEGRRTLEAVTFTYLGEWIDRQRQHAAAGEEGADGRLAAALVLQSELQKILDGEPPYDIFVRWKPLHGQPLGWDPDIDDGVRLNIRPFLMAKDVRARNAGILRARPDSTWVNATKPGVGDRGKEPENSRPRESFPWYWGCDPEAHLEHRVDFGAGNPGTAPAGKSFTGVRWNGLHYSRAAKDAARAAAAEGAREAGTRGGVRP
jgi:hypothetical protein